MTTLAQAYQLCQQSIEDFHPKYSFSVRHSVAALRSRPRSLLQMGQNIFSFGDSILPGPYHLPLFARPSTLLTPFNVYPQQVGITIKSLMLTTYEFILRLIQCQEYSDKLIRKSKPERCVIFTWIIYVTCSAHSHRFTHISASLHVFPQADSSY